MSRSANQKVYADFSGGFITDFNELSIPDSAVRDINNLDILDNATVKKRPGLAVVSEGFFDIPTSTVADFNERAFQVYEWTNVNGNPDISLVVVQTGRELRFFYNTELGPFVDYPATELPWTPYARYFASITDDVLWTGTDSTQDTVQQFADITAEEKDELEALLTDDISSERVPYDFAQIDGQLVVAIGNTVPQLLSFRFSAFDYEDTTIQRLLRKENFFGDDTYQPFQLTPLFDEFLPEVKGLISSRPIELRTRIFDTWEGDTDEETGLVRTSSMSGIHEWNLVNGGWDADVDIMRAEGTNSAISGDTNLIRAVVLDINEYPSIKTPLWAGINGGGDSVRKIEAINTFRYKSNYFKSGANIAGHLIENPFFYVRSGEAYDNTYTRDPDNDARQVVISGGSYPRVVESYAGRVWYAGVDSTGYNSNIYFSQIAQEADSDSLAKCYQAADPTSEEDNTIVSTDGGEVKIRNIGNVIAMKELGAFLVVFGRNGIWTISGVDGNSFDPSSFSVNKISDRELLSKETAVFTGSSIFFAANEALYVIQPNEQTGRLEVQNITSEKIKKFFYDIPEEAKRNSKLIFNNKSSIMYWFYNEDHEPLSKLTHNKVLAFNLDLGAFYKYDIKSEQGSQETEKSTQDIGWEQIPFTRNTGADTVIDIVWSEYLSRFVSLSDERGQVYFSDPNFISWTTQQLPTNRTWVSITSADSLGILVAVSSDGFAATSTNGESWTVNQIGAGFAGATKVRWSPEQSTLLAIRVGQTTPYATSTDGVSWTVLSDTATDTLTNLIWISNTNSFIIGSEEGNIHFVEVVGATITPSVSPAGLVGGVKDLAFRETLGEERIVTAPVDRAGTFYYSDNFGSTWTAATAPNPTFNSPISTPCGFTQGSWEAVGYADPQGFFVAVHSDDSSGYFISIDGDVWVQQFDGPEERLFHLTWSPSEPRFLTSQRLCAEQPDIDNIAWEEADLPSSDQPPFIVFADHLNAWVAVYPNGLVHKSFDGGTWEETADVSRGVGSRVSALAYSPVSQSFVLMKRDYDDLGSLIWSSEDAVNWFPRVFEGDWLDSNGNVIVSADDDSQGSGSRPPWGTSFFDCRTVHWVESLGMFIAGAQRGEFLQSTTGVLWEELGSNKYRSTDWAYNPSNGRFITTLFPQARFFTSGIDLYRYTDDGTTWIGADEEFTAFVGRVVYMGPTINTFAMWPTVFLPPDSSEYEAFFNNDASVWTTDGPSFPTKLINTQDFPNYSAVEEDEWQAEIKFAGWLPDFNRFYFIIEEFWQDLDPETGIRSPKYEVTFAFTTDGTTVTFSATPPIIERTGDFLYNSGLRSFLYGQAQGGSRPLFESLGDRNKFFEATFIEPIVAKIPAMFSSFNRDYTQVLLDEFEDISYIVNTNGFLIERRPTGIWRFSQIKFINDETWEDVTGTYTSLLDIGFDSFQDIMNKAKKAPVIVAHFERTETGFKLDEDLNLQYEKPSSCMFSYKWDWGTSFSFPVEIYRYLRDYIPLSVQDPLEYDRDVITTKTRVRGRGTSFGMRFESSENKDMRLLGVGILYTARDDRL